ncbi:MAG: ABC transporter permease [Betaproteobacteria bacterium]|nr:MAG: ABC transporter permease [Betaproteobacteria bacterium]
MNLVTHHHTSLRDAWQRLRLHPWSNLFSILVIGIALSLPTGLFLLMSNLDRASNSFAEQTEMTVFLKTKTEMDAAQALADAVRAEPGVRRVRLIPREDALAELQHSGLDDILTSLTANPLPHSLVVEPTDSLRVRQLEQRLRQHPEVEAIASVAAWAQRLDALKTFGAALTWSLALLLSLALLAIIGNTIRLQIYAQRDAIEISRLIGATDRFIRRPFLYFGALQGGLGGLVAIILSGGGIFWLNRSVAELAVTYGSSFRLANLDLQTSALVLVTATLLGLLGAWASVAHTLRDFD